MNEADIDVKTGDNAPIPLMLEATDYAGDVTPLTAWEALQKNKMARLVDVRTQAEWHFVGVVREDMEGQVALIEWQSYPAMTLNENFISELKEAVPDQSAPLFFLCRSGVRSQNAAIKATQNGWQAAFNIKGGFEGAQDEHHHRGTCEGWKAAGLPWVQN